MEETHELKLDPEHQGNKPYYAICNEASELLEKVDKLHLGLDKIKMPKLFPFRANKQLTNLKKEINKIIPDVNNFWIKAKKFTEQPSFYVTYRADAPLDQVVGYFHFSLLLLNRITTLENIVNNTVRDLQSFSLRIDGVKSLFWALLFFTFSIIVTIIISA